MKQDECPPLNQYARIKPKQHSALLGVLESLGIKKAK